MSNVISEEDYCDEMFQATGTWCLFQWNSDHSKPKQPLNEQKMRWYPIVHLRRSVANLPTKTYGK